jgi:hypothetical protein
MYLNRVAPAVGRAAARGWAEYGAADALADSLRNVPLTDIEAWGSDMWSNVAHRVVGRADISPKVIGETLDRLRRRNYLGALGIDEGDAPAGGGSQMGDPQF